MSELYIGAQGWSYPDWVGSFYPPESKQEHWLPFYAEVFRSVELDTTFYHPPKPTIVRSWARHTPETFRFAAKVPQAITHVARLAKMAEQIETFVRALDPLGARRGPLLVQMPADFVRDEGTVGVLDRFLAACPSQAKIAVEFRSRSWHDERTWQLLRRRRACLVWSEWRDLPPVTEVTGDFLYLRWMGHREAITRFDRVRIDRGSEFDAWHAAIERALPQVGEVYGYFNNHWAGHSPASAAEMLRRLGYTTVEPKTLWPQQELW